MGDLGGYPIESIIVALIIGSLVLLVGPRFGQSMRVHVLGFIIAILVFFIWLLSGSL